MQVDGAKLRRVRERQLMTQPELSEKSGVMVATISRIENGMQQPRIPTVRKLARALDINPEELLIWDDEGKAKKAASVV